jgi:Spy/CpxP family protein refolding chaperone
MMKRAFAGLLAIAVLVGLVVTAGSQPPEGKSEKGDKGGKKGPPRFELGRVLPPFARDQLNLTAEQEKQIADLEKMVGEQLNKILTAEQKDQLASMRPKGKGDDGPGGKRGPKDGGFDGKKKGPPPDKE